MSELFLTGLKLPFGQYERGKSTVIRRMKMLGIYSKTFMTAARMENMPPSSELSRMAHDVLPEAKIAPRRVKKQRFGLLRMIGAKFRPAKSGMGVVTHCEG
ncbi:hypothetical protein [Salipiger sp. CCB-MM3]|uniref:hypothetical protein n=1 Tax=Salipiger sp. CCB-MM3 TaxID=1792508 RepID=UPI0012F732C9|nr:hypothetical protein [Salipiger sp. CCB-MM3]